MYNDFVIVGPPEDPAGIRGMTDVAAASEASLPTAQQPFISRGDDSGTHISRSRAYGKPVVWQLIEAAKH
jgi:tungstate transport system substrate-binding protein